MCKFRYRNVRQIVLVFLSFVLLACGLSTEQRKEAKEAVEALQKIQAGVQTGNVNRMNLSSMLVEAKAQVNQAEILPQGALKEELKGAIDAYLDGFSVWEAMKGSGSSQIVYSYNPLTLVIKGKYPDNPEKTVEYMSDTTRDYLFELGNTRLDNAVKLLGKS